jgi:hypothetical protein
MFFFVFLNEKFCQNAKIKNKEGRFCENILTFENFAKFSKTIESFLSHLDYDFSLVAFF